MINRGFDSDFLAKLKERNDIVTTISKYITLQRKGRGYWACCPFHGEKTPSFSVKEDGQFYKCFGCGESGYVITFIEKFENVDFMTAVEILCKNAGMEMPSFKGNEEIEKKKKLRDRLYLALNLATEFYMTNLYSLEGKKHLDYLKNRGITDELIKKFKIGASLDYDSLVKFMQSRGFSSNELLQSGLVGVNDYGKYYDFYAKRVIFPIFNNFSDVIGFSARDISGEQNIAKYKNTPQTMLFSKGQVLYGYNFIKEEKKRGNLNEVIIVEGQMDTIACHGAGLVNTIGCMGTALTSNHAKELQRLTDNILVCLDGDNAGEVATFKAIDCLRQIGLSVKVVRLKEAKDPDEYIKKFGASAFIKTLQNAMPFMDFIIEDISKKYDLKNNDELNKFINEALSYISKLLSPSEQEIYLNLVYKISKIPKDILRKTLSGSMIEKKVDELEFVNTFDATTSAKICVLANILYGKLKDFDGLQEYFDDSETKEIFAYFTTKAKENRLIASSIFDDFEIQPDSILDKILNFKFNLQENVNVNYLNECIKTLKSNLLKKKKLDLMNSLLKANSIDERAEILKKLQDIDKILKGND